MTESTAERGDRAQLPSLTGLRFVAAFLVLVAHAAHTVMVIDPPFYLPFGSAIAFIGMTIFFVLSGFVIHYNYGRLFRTQPLGTAVSTFAVARVSRLYPLFFFCFLVALSTTPLASVFPIRTYLFAFLTTMTQSWIFVEVSPNAILCTSFYPHAWSISTEIFFYLLYPLVVAFVGRAGGPVRATVTAVLWTATSYGFLYWVHSTNGGGLKWLVLWPSPGDLADGIWAGYIGYLNPLIRLPEFVLGCLTAQVYLGVEGKLVGRRERVIGRAITYLALALMVAGPAWYYLSTFRVPGVLPPLPAFVGFLNFNFLLAPAVAVFLFAAVRYPTLVTRPLNWRPVVVLGEASYSIYLLHPWVLHVFLAPGPQKFSDLVACEWAVRMVMSVGFCLCISLGTYAAIEVPGRRWLRGALGWAAGVRAPAAGWRRPVFAVAVYAVPCAGIAAGMYLFRTTTAPAQLLATGNQLAGAGRTDDAVRCYDRALELNPRMSAALFQRAMLRVNGQDRGQAVADFNRILDVDPRGAFAAYAIIYRGYARLSDTEYSAAEADLTAGLARSPGNGLAYFWRGVARQHLGRLPDAEADFAKAVEHDPKLFQACYQLGEVRRSLGDLPGAEAAFAAGTKANPHWAACYYERGTLSARDGRTEEARADFDTVIRLDPAFIPARTARAALGPVPGGRAH